MKQGKTERVNFFARAAGQTGKIQPPTQAARLRLKDMLRAQRAVQSQPGYIDPCKPDDYREAPDSKAPWADGWRPIGYLRRMKQGL